MRTNFFLGTEMKKKLLMFWVQKNKLSCLRNMRAGNLLGIGKTIKTDY